MIIAIIIVFLRCTRTSTLSLKQILIISFLVKTN